MLEEDIEGVVDEEFDETPAIAEKELNQAAKEKNQKPEKQILAPVERESTPPKSFETDSQIKLRKKLTENLANAANRLNGVNKMIGYRPTPSRHRRYLALFLLALRVKLKGKNGIKTIRNRFNQVVREAKTVCEDPMNADGFDSQSYYLAGCMLDYKNLKQEIMNINTIDDVDEDMANRILLRLEPAYARSGHEAA